MGGLSFQNFFILEQALGNHLAAIAINNLLGPQASGVTFYVDGSGIALPGGTLPNDLNQGTSQTSAFKTIGRALDAVVGGRGDLIVIAPASYDEAVVIDRSKGGVTLLGNGTQGSIGIAPSTAAAKALVNNADSVTLINIDMAGNTTATYGCFSTGSQFRAINCKFEGTDTSGAACGVGPGSVAQVAAGTAGNCGDVKFINCEFAWTYNGLAFVASDYGAATQVEVISPWYHNNSNTCVIGVPGAFGIGSVRNLNHKNGSLGRMEDGTAPSDFVNVNTAFDTGIFCDNFIAIATNAVADLKVGAKVLWVANATEAGFSTARPA